MSLTEVQTADITWALNAFNASVIVGTVSSTSVSRGELMQTYADYYNGDHPLLFATNKFRETFGTTFRANIENLCQLPVDILTDLLQIEGFAARNGDDPEIGRLAGEIWRRNRMDERAGQVHKNTSLFGESYVIAWRDEEGRAVIYPNLPGNVVVQYHAEKLGYIVKGAKFWKDFDRFRLTIYTPELITRYRSKAQNGEVPSAADAFELHDTETVPAEQANAYGKVPVFRFVNNAGIGSAGESELRNIIPPQDRLNKHLCDSILASEYASYPQRFALGYEIRKDADGKVINPFKSGPDRMWINENPEGSFGQLSPGDLSQYLLMIDDARKAVARISGIPPHYFGMDAGGWPSGESLKSASDRLTKKAVDRQTSHGNTWSDVMRFCLEIEGQPDVEVDTLWTDPAPRLSELESWQAAAAEQAAGGSRNKTLADRGYSVDQIAEAQQARQQALYGEPVLASADDREDDEQPA